MTIVGARPQFIKASILSEKFKNNECINEVLVHTGQHFDVNMSDSFFEDLNIPKPNYKLSINSLGHGAMTGRMIEEIERILKKEAPDLVIVYGDTNSTLAGAIATKKLGFKLAHIEAGLRSFNNKMPEEINRILTDRVSDYLFCPTNASIVNLKREGFEYFDCKIELVGDIMEDTAINFFKIAQKKSNILQKTPSYFILCTVHRAENTKNRKKLENLVKAINYINDHICNVVLPLHPSTKKALESFNLKLECKIIKPVGYLDMLLLINNSQSVMTDSGGLQKEAFFLNKFCITLRDETEWTELTDFQYNHLVGADHKKIIKKVRQSLNKKFEKKHDFYGGGKASDKIVEFIKSNLN